MTTSLFETYPSPPRRTFQSTLPHGERRMPTDRSVDQHHVSIRVFLHGRRARQPALVRPARFDPCFRKGNIMLQSLNSGVGRVQSSYSRGNLYNGLRATLLPPATQLIQLRPRRSLGSRLIFRSVSNLFSTRSWLMGSVVLWRSASTKRLAACPSSTSWSAGVSTSTYVAIKSSSMGIKLLQKTLRWAERLSRTPLMRSYTQGRRLIQPLPFNPSPPSRTKDWK
jgi:hypothetical protein